MKKKLGIILLSSLMLTGCSTYEFEKLLEDSFSLDFSILAGDSMTSDAVFSEHDRKRVNDKVVEMEERFNHQIDKYQSIADSLWDKQGYYNRDDEMSEQEKLIDFYLFMEYHMDTQIRHLQYPEYVKRELLLIESLFAKKAIDHIKGEDFAGYEPLKNDMVLIYEDLYQEELMNILYENSEQMRVMDRIPGLVDRTKARIENTGLMERIEDQLGIPTSLIGRGMGLNMVTLYSEMGYLDVGDPRELAIILAMELRLSGIDMRLERFFYLENSLSGVGEELSELKKDVSVLRNDGSLSWVQDRMNRAIDHLDKVYKFYKGDTKFNSIEDVFITLETREDFYALGMLSDHLKEVMDREDYWDEMEKVREMMVEGRYIESE